jgi:hypothetical protein
VRHSVGRRLALTGGGDCVWTQVVGRGRRLDHACLGGGELGSLRHPATTADDTRALCNVVYTFRGRGEISTTGVSPLSGAADIDPIVGGDRQFRNVRGQVDFGNSTGTTIRVTLELQP